MWGRAEIQGMAEIEPSGDLCCLAPGTSELVGVWGGGVRRWAGTGAECQEETQQAGERWRCDLGREHLSLEEMTTLKRWRRKKKMAEALSVRGWDCEQRPWEIEKRFWECW